MNVIKNFNDGTYLKYDNGNFDRWCVYYVDENSVNKALTDFYYFEKMRKLALKYGIDRVHNDFLKVYNSTGKSIEVRILNTITQVSFTYDSEDSLEVDKLFTILYATMIAEENKKNTKLGKRIKRLGIYELLYGEKNVEYATNFMKGMNWRDIEQLCKEKGF